MTAAAAVRQPRYQPGDLVVLDGTKLCQVVQAWDAWEPPAPGDDDGSRRHIGRWPSYSLRPPGPPCGWENAAWEGRLSPAPDAAVQMGLFGAEEKPGQRFILYLRQQRQRRQRALEEGVAW